MLNTDFKNAIAQIEKVLDKQLFFVCGVMKSGTTWLERMLDSHPEVVCKGEAHFSGNLVRPMAQLIDEYNESVQTKGGAIAHLKVHGGATDVLSYDNEDVEYLSVSAIALMYGKWLKNDNAKCIGDKTPGNLEDIPVLSKLFPEAKFIHIIRDGRDNAVSLWNFNINTNIGKTVERWGTFEDFSRAFASNWAGLVKEGRAVGQGLGSTRYVEVYYEDLLNQPFDELIKLLEFLGVDTSTQVVNKCLDDSTFEKLSGGRQSGVEDSQSFYRKGISGDWKNHFSEDLHSEFQSLSGEILQELGYTSR